MNSIKNAQYAKSVITQTRIVYNYMRQQGSINRYEADQNGVCHLAARVQNLEELGLVYKHIDENDVKDFHGIAHNGIRRYFIDWKQMEPEAIEYFNGWSHD